MITRRISTNPGIYTTWQETHYRYDERSCRIELARADGDLWSRESGCVAGSRLHRGTRERAVSHRVTTKKVLTRTSEYWITPMKRDHFLLALPLVVLLGAFILIKLYVVPVGELRCSPPIEQLSFGELPTSCQCGLATTIEWKGAVSDKDLDAFTSASRSEAASLNLLDVVSLSFSAENVSQGSLARFVSWRGYPILEASSYQRSIGLLMLDVYSRPAQSPRSNFSRIGFVGAAKANAPLKGVQLDQVEKYESYVREHPQPPLASVTISHSTISELDFYLLAGLLPVAHLRLIDCRVTDASVLIHSEDVAQRYIELRDRLRANTQERRTHRSLSVEQLAGEWPESIVRLIENLKDE